MDKKTLKHVTLALRRSCHYVNNLESDYTSRFDFVVTESNEVEIFNADKDNDLFLWADVCLSIAVAFECTYYIHIDTYGTQKLCFHIG